MKGGFMNHDSLKNALQEGLMAEMDSVVLYETASKKADGEVKDFFVQRAEEEKSHYNYLLDLYKKIDERDMSGWQGIEKAEGEKPYSPVISDDFLKRIAKDQILFSAMSTAALLEIKSVDFYRRKKEEAHEPVLKRFFASMEQWEKEHYETVLKIQEEAKQFYWDINRFEPF
ncbi:MAG TPA: hypothetical protein ENN72_07440 [Firmicutes bacterium]|nr:hypothetical protein [Bacillota bacterium]